MALGRSMRRRHQKGEAYVESAQRQGQSDNESKES
jgi:hypothetical protein